MFVGETELQYMLDLLCQDYCMIRWGTIDIKLKATVKKWIQTYNLQDKYPALWEEVSTGS